ncbi:MAG: hypothetical protein HUJ96_04015 [Marinilabiliaceae bacterium]|nr:hypothetical protein [Marinilabiliaceae bacterium]
MARLIVTVRKMGIGIILKERTTSILRYFRDDLADSLWIESYNDVYPNIKQSFFMYNDTVRGYIYQYDIRGHFQSLNYYNKSGVCFRWNYHNDICTDSIYDISLTSAHALMDNDLANMKYGIIDFCARDTIKYNVLILSMMLIVNFTSHLRERKSRLIAEIEKTMLSISIFCQKKISSLFVHLQCNN